MKTKAMFPGVTQNEMGFPMQLTEKYRPATVDGFVGLPLPKAVFGALLKAPRADAFLLIGPPGSGKTSMALAFARQLGGSLIHLASAKLTVDAVAETWERVQYYPRDGKFWVIVADEADRMSGQAQVALLSLLDSAAALRPVFGGGFEQGAPIPVIWIFTCNGTGETQTEPPATLEKRFLSRCKRIPFDTKSLNGDLSKFLAKVWKTETASPAPDLDSIAHGAAGSVRDALQSLDLELLMRGVVQPVAEKPAIEEKSKPVSARAEKVQRPRRADFGAMFAWANR